VSDRRLRAVPAPTGPAYAIAVRVSRVMGRSGDRFLSPEIQITASRAAVERLGGHVDTTVGDNGVFYDLDVSGATAPSERAGLGAALELVRAGALSGVAVYDLSRFSRDTAGGLAELEAIALAGGQVISATETIDISSPHGLFATTIQLAAARLKRDESSRAWKATHQSRHERGLPHGKVPLGYLPDGNGGVAVDPLLAAVMTKAFADYAAGVTSQMAIAEQLTLLRGRLTRQGVVSRFLRNPFFTGVVSYHGDVRQGQHLALVPDEVFEAVQRRLREEFNSQPRDRVPTTCLAGLIFCGTCKRRLHSIGRNGPRLLPNGELRPARLACSGMRPFGCSGIGTPQVELLEMEVRARALLLASGLRDGTPELATRTARATRARADAAQLRAEQRELKASIGRAGSLLARNVYDEVEYAATVAELRRDMATVTARLYEAEASASHPGQSPERLASAAALIEAEWNGMTPQERRAALRLFIERVELAPAAYRGQPWVERLDYPEPQE
jgi:site-specific DNA recombinase